jgi:tetratricopeptide (TPR) repeat protein
MTLAKANGLAALGAFIAVVATVFAPMPARAEQHFCYQTKGQESLDACSREIADHSRSQHDTALSYANRAITYANMDNYQKALEDTDMAIRIWPTFQFAFNVRSKIYEKLGKADLAKKDATERDRLERVCPKGC